MGITSVGLAVSGYLVFRLIYWNRILPKVWVGEVMVSGLAQEAAVEQLREAERIFFTYQATIRLHHDHRQWELPVSQLQLVFEPRATTAEAYALGRGGGIWQQLTDQLALAQRGRVMAAKLSFDKTAVADFVASAAAEVSSPLVPTRLIILPQAENGSRVKIERGEAGRVVNQEKVLAIIEQRLSRYAAVDLAVETEAVEERLSDEQIEQTRLKAEKLLDKELAVEFRHQDRYLTWTLAGEDLVGFLSFNDTYAQEKIASYVETVATAVDQLPQNALFQFEPTSGRVSAFLPGKDGLVLDRTEAEKAIRKAMDALLTEEEAGPVTLVAKVTAPEVTNEEVNQLGIRTLLGRGESTFFGSIPSRIHNIKLTASRLNGVLIKPLETFSFNNTIGEVAAATGFQPAYVISQGRTVLGDGGGVCQDSTTLFRAVLDAGLPVVERRGHSYRVGYYEQNSKAGYDATVYAPTTDFKFLNDTPAYILIQAKVEGMKLMIDLYGTSDGRQATTSNYALWDVTPPPPDLFQDDPTLPTGTVKQVDWKAWGAKTKFDYKVTRGGEVIFQKTFYTTFQPWQSVFLRGTASQ
ncbi:hypothetical protein A2783_01600 [Microgenomates group bacterium RIFCSPHIGHO2_01_FULL_45_11]|nr:MAG: hypothetical protein A2783_01600 [Microgenomates group bacterium RIFCSPHIGHO2_01_FULL_45_11]